MKQIKLTTKFDFTVPQDVIDALWNMYDRYKQEFDYNTTIIKNGQLDGLFKDSIIIYEMQVPENKNLLKDDSISQIMAVENLKLRTEWLFYDDNVKIVESFIKSHFSSAFHFRIDTLFANCSLGWHDKHPYPRVFIPMHDNSCRFLIKNEHESQVNTYSPGECMMWDVRKRHSVDNTKSINDRIMACFNIDPECETNQQIFI
jgi:hypothetical protein